MFDKNIYLSYYEGVTCTLSGGETGPRHARRVEVMVESIKLPAVGRDFITEAGELIKSGAKPGRLHKNGEPSFADTYVLAKRLEAECVGTRGRSTKVI
jgi:hypothetical protein